METSCREPRDPSEYRHDGFFARAHTGLAVFSAHVEGSLGHSNRSRITGYGQSAEVSLGATVLPGIVVGMSVSTARLDPRFVENGTRISPDDDSVKLTLARIGPVLFWYPSPSRGFNAQVASGLVLLAENDVKGNPIEPGAVGVGLAVGVGHEWFVSPQVSIGFTVRMSGGRVTRAAGGRRERTLWEAPEAALTYTYH